MSNDTIHITIRDDMSEELHLASEEGMPKYVGAEASVTRIENGVSIRLKDYKGETIETVFEAIESITFNNDGTMTITLPDGRTFTSGDLTGPQGPRGIQGIQGNPGVDGQDGSDGIDGFSPIVSITDITGGHRISITDAEGTSTANVMDGQKGDTGDTGATGNGITSILKTGTSGLVDTYTITFTDKTTATFTVTNGATPVVEIEDVKVNNASLPIVNKSVNIDLTDYALKSDISSVYKYKGTVSTYADLPASGMAVGDTYNIETADSTHDIKAGDNVAWTGTGWDKIGGDVDLSSYALKAELPKKVSELTNDSGFIDSSALPTSLSELTNDMDVSDFPNDAGYLITETDPTVPAWAKASTKPSYTASEVGALPSTTFIPSDTGDLTNGAGYITSSALPTALSDLNNDMNVGDFPNDAGYLTTHQDISGKADKANTDINQSVITLATSMGWTAPSP